MDRVGGKVALVTGALGGIGAACVSTLKEQGATVFSSDIADARRENGSDGYLRHDVSSASDWQRVVASVLDTSGRIDALVHCAGIEGSHERGLSTSEEDWNRVLAVNLTGSFLACKTVFPSMLAQGTGSVILLSSAVSDMATAGAIAYGASKAAIAHLAKSFAVVGAQEGARVRCNTVHPGSIRTRMSDSMFTAVAKSRGITFEQVEERVSAAIPFGKRGEPTDIANAVLYLCSDEAAYVTGTEFKIDGGWSLKSAG